MRRSAATLAFASGLGFGLPGVAGIRHLRATGEVWTLLGFPTYGEGPFERVGIDTTVPLLTMFVGTCAAEVVVGALLWRGSPRGTALSLVLLPAELAFWTGFALPFGPALGLARGALGVAADAGRR